VALRIEIAEPAEPAALQRIERGLVEHAVACGVEPRNHRTLGVVLRDETGEVLGGLVGSTVWGWLQVAQLWLDGAVRGKGHGVALMRAAEAEAVRRGCHHALLDTFDFQARGFYEGLGYRVFGEVLDFPTGHTRFFMEKAL